jgi:hypothetical protein
MLVSCMAHPSLEHEPDGDKTRKCVYLMMFDMNLMEPKLFIVSEF